MMNARKCQNALARKTVDSLGIKGVFREAIASGRQPWKAHLLLYLSEPDCATDYIRIMGPVLLNDALSRTLTFCITRLAYDEEAQSFNISERVLDRFPLTIVVSREKISTEALGALRLLKDKYPSTRIWIDIDDDLFSITEAHPEYDQYARRLDVLGSLIGLSDTVTVSTAGVKQGLVSAGYGEKLPIIVPNYLDDRIWQSKPRQKQPKDPSKIRVLYSGTETHDADLKTVVEAIRTAQEIVKRQLKKDLEVVVVGGTTTKLPGMNIVRVPDSMRFYTSYIPWLQSMRPFDFAIAPLDLDNKLNWSKSALKYLEYSAMGLPAIFTEIEPYARVVNSHENGILIPGNSKDAWAEALVSLASDHQLAQRISNQCRTDVTANRLLSQHFGEWKSIIEPE